MTENIDLTKTETLAPFDIENWLTSAVLPQESVDVYRAGNVPAEASALKRQIEIERRIEDVERSSDQVDNYVEFEKQYVEVLKRWAESRLTIFVSAIDPERLREIRAKHDTKTEGMDVAVANELFGFKILAEAVVGIAEPGKTYQGTDGNPAPYEPVKWEPRHVRGLQKAIGYEQTKQLLDARRKAQSTLPTVDADFLHRSSGQDEPTTGA